MIRAVIFDLMGTIAVSTESDTDEWQSFMHAHLVEFGLVADVDGLIAAWDNSERRPSEGHTPFEEQIHRVASSLDLKLSWPEVVSIAEGTCERSAGFLELDSDALSLLDTLDGRVETALVTNYDHPPEVHRFLEILELTGAFDPVIISGELGIWKPDPRILHAALSALGVRPEEAIYVGDSGVDVEASLAAGVLPVFVAREDGRADPFRAPEEGVEVEYADLIRLKRVRVIGRLMQVADLLSE